MLKRAGGAIVNTSSSASVIGGPEVAYGVSKAGVDALTRAIANKWSPEGIRVNAIAPGLIHSPTGDDYLADHNIPVDVVSLQKRGGHVEEVAALASFLLSEECPYLTGQIIGLNGGSYLSPL